MPGIAGIIRPDVQRGGDAQVQAMVATMRHENFYRCGHLLDAPTAAGVGWAVHAGSFAQGNPFWNDTGDVALVWTGEDFSELAPAAGGEAAPERRRARALLAAYERWGSTFADRLNGTFAGVVIDRRFGRVVLFNDRYGLSRMHVHERGGTLYFSSEAKAILRVVPWTRHLDDQGLAEYAACGCALQGRTIFRDVRLLPPGACWTFEHGRCVERASYFDAGRWESLPPLSAQAWREQLDAIFPQVVARRLEGPQAVAMSLTGGLDGRMIMACSGRKAGALPCYTFGGPIRDCADVTLARRVAQACHQPYAVIGVDADFLQTFGTLAERAVEISDGAMDVTGAVELYANARARRVAPVRLTGNYGSEILRSNVAFRPRPVDDGVYAPDFVREVAQAARTYANAMLPRALSTIVTRQVPWHHTARLAVEESQLTMRSPYLDDDLVRLAFQTPRGQETAKEPALQFVADHDAALARIPTDRALLHRPVPGLSTLAHWGQEFLFRAEYAWDYGMPDWLSRIERHLAPLHAERWFLGRHKFYHFRHWYRGPLAGYLQQVLLDPRSDQRPHLQPGRLQTLVREHLAGERNHTTTLHQLLSIELIYRRFIDAIPCGGSRGEGGALGDAWATIPAHRSPQGAPM